MTGSEILALCRDSSQLYLDSLHDNGRGREIVPATLQKVNADLYALHLQKALFSVDGSIFLNIDGRDYCSTEFSFAEYDREQLMLFMRPTTEKAKEGLNHARNISVVTDLTFLVSRLHKLYEEKLDLVFPMPKPDTTIIKGYQYPDSVSEGQKKAIKTVFENGQTYIWGAPGTGKTRYVLSQCLLAYLKNGNKSKKIIVLAPTNNALEQVLYGVLEELQNAGIDDKHVLRLGIPTRSFAERHPSVCEEKGIEKQIEALQNQLNIYQRAQEYRACNSRYQRLKKVVTPALNSVPDEVDKLNEAKRSYAIYSRQATQYREKMDSQKREIESNQMALRTLHIKLDSVPFKSIGLLSNKRIYKIKGQISTTEAIIAALEKELTTTNIAYADSHTKEIQYRDSVASFTQELERTVASIKTELNRYGGELTNISRKLTVQNIQDSLLKAKAVLQKDDEYITNNNAQNECYRDFTDLQLTNRVNELTEQIAALKKETRKSRIERAAIIAATVDTFYGILPPNEVTESGLKIAHIFLDEAGYCSLIKGILLASYGCPITLLGDHMQLPPVCEIDRLTINRNPNKKIILWSASTIYLENAFYADSFDTLYNTLYAYDEPSMIDMKRTDLTRTYRFDNKLATILDKCVYHNGFSSALHDNTMKIECVDAPYIRGGEKHQNINEASEVCKLINALQGTEYAVLTPYVNQRRLIQNQSGLNPTERASRILTVHASQGKEWDTVIVSVADAYQGWFTNTKNRNSGALQLLNTAVSRAKKRLIIVCNKSYWAAQQDQFISDLIKDY